MKTTTDITPAADSGALDRRYANDVRKAEAGLDKARLAPVAEGARLVCDYTLLCGSTYEVDAIAAEWRVPAGWTADLTQYRTLGSGWPVNIVAAYIPPAARQVAA